MFKSLLSSFLVSLLTTLLFIIGTIAGCYTFTSNQIRIQNENAAVNSLAETVRYAETTLETQKSMGEVAASHNEVVRFLAGTPLEKMELRDNVRSLLTNFVSFSSGAVMAYLYSPEQSWLSATDRSTLESNRAFLISRALARDYHLQSAFRNHIVTRSYSCGDEYYYAVITAVFRPIAAPQLSDFEGCLVMIYRTDCLAKAIPENGSVEGFIHSSGTFLGGDKSAFLRWRQSAANSISRSIAGTDWVVELVLNKKNKSDTLLHMRLFCWVVSLTSLISISVLTIIQYRRMVHPIMEIANQTVSIHRDGDLLVDHYANINELSQLVKGINEMLIRLNQLNEEILQVRTKYYEEQIAFFQAQINPHFLYNTFECIRGMATEGKMEEVRRATSCMAGIYRYCAAKPALVPLRNEYDCLKQYMQVMELRYGPVYQLTLEGDKNALDSFVPRMCLQPLVENAITHGFHTMPKTVGHIRVTSSLTDGTLLLVMEDDGDGMSEEEMNYYNAIRPVRSESLHNHIGITNIMLRFQLLFPDCVLIHFSSAANGGLKVEIRIANNRINDKSI